MKTGIFITARLGSTRLKQKHLLPAVGRPLLEYLLKRITNSFSEEISRASISIVIATADQPENRKFEEFSNKAVQVFYGSSGNIPLRHLEAADTLGFEKIIAVDGDDILCSIDGMKQIYRALSDGCDYVKTSNLPFGMNSFGYSREFLAESLEGNKLDLLETGWGRIFPSEKLIDIPMEFAVQREDLRFTLDYPEDYTFFKTVIEKFGNNIFQASDQDIVEKVISDQLYCLNEKISREYWANFRAKVAEEADN